MKREDGNAAPEDDDSEDNTDVDDPPPAVVHQEISLSIPFRASSLEYNQDI